LSPWFCGELQAAGLPAVCIETRRMKSATAAMAVNTDRNDARAIAQAMRVGWFTAVHVKTTESQELRLLPSNRKMLLTSRILAQTRRRFSRPKRAKSQGSERTWPWGASVARALQIPGSGSSAQIICG
jgi:transposase